MATLSHFTEDGIDVCDEYNFFWNGKYAANRRLAEWIFLKEMTASLLFFWGDKYLTAVTS